MGEPVRQLPRRGPNLLLPALAAALVLGFAVTYWSSSLPGASDDRAGSELADRLEKAQPGATVTISAGKYMFPRTVHLARAIHLVGTGHPVLMAPGDNYVLVMAPPVGETSSLDGLVLTRAPGSSGNVLSHARGHLVLRHCEVALGRRTPGSHAVSWAGAGIVGEPHTALELDHVQIKENRGDGLTTRGEVTIVDSVIKGSGDHAITLGEGAHLKATRLRLEGNRDGIEANHADVALDHCVLEDSGTAVWLRSESHGVLRDNQLHGNYVGVDVEMSSVVEMARNHISGNRAAGVQKDPRGLGRLGPSRVVSKDDVVEAPRSSAAP